MGTRAVKHSAAPDFLYKKVANEIAASITRGTWKHGDKMPSVRSVVSSYKVSMSTAVKVYYELEARLLIEARPKSGYYVCDTPARSSKLQRPKIPASQASSSVDTIIQDIYNSLNATDMVKLSVGVPASELLPIGKMN